MKYSEKVKKRDSFYSQFGGQSEFITSEFDFRDTKLLDFPVQVFNLLTFLEDFCKYSHTPRKEVQKWMPAYLFDVKRA
jgi:hypothetical protein